MLTVFAAVVPNAVLICQSDLSNGIQIQSINEINGFLGDNKLSLRGYMYYGCRKTIYWILNAPYHEQTSEQTKN